MHDGLERVSLPARMESLDAFMEFTHAGARAAQLPEDEIPKLDLILEEILVNIFRYAHPPGEDGTAEVAYRAEPGALKVQIRDKGKAYNPLAETAEPDLTLGIE